MPDHDGNILFSPKELFMEIRDSIKDLSNSVSKDIHNLAEQFSLRHSELDTRVRKLEEKKIGQEAIDIYSKSIRGLTWAVSIALLGVLGNLAAHYFWH